MRRLIAYLVALVLLLSPILAWADEPPAGQTVLQFMEPVPLTTPSGKVLTLGPGIYVPAPLWARLDAEVRRLQKAEVLLQGENAELKVQLDRAPRFSSKLVALGLGVAAGLVAGAGLAVVAGHAR